MNIQLAPTGLNPFDDPLDRILAEIALSVQLPPSLHDKAKSRYEAVRRHLEATTAFFDQIEHFYPQGSMAIDATISTRGTDDEFDLDIVSQVGGRFRGMTPLEILTTLEAAGKGNADKQAMIAAMRERGFEPADDNEADAIAILLWALEMEGGVA